MNAIEDELLIACLQTMAATFVFQAIPDEELLKLISRIENQRELLSLEKVKRLSASIKRLDMKAFLEEVEDQHGRQNVPVFRNMSRMIRTALKDCMAAGADLRLQYFE